MFGDSVPVTVDNKDLQHEDREQDFLYTLRHTRFDKIRFTSSITTQTTKAVRQETEVCVHYGSHLQKAISPFRYVLSEPTMTLIVPGIDLVLGFTWTTCHSGYQIPLCRILPQRCITTVHRERANKLHQRLATATTNCN